jgi:hypothetical protein
MRSALDVNRALPDANTVIELAWHAISQLGVRYSARSRACKLPGSVEDLYSRCALKTDVDAPSMEK